MLRTSQRCPAARAGSSRTAGPRLTHAASSYPFNTHTAHYPNHDLRRSHPRHREGQCRATVLSRAPSRAAHAPPTTGDHEELQDSRRHGKGHDDLPNRGGHAHGQGLRRGPRRWQCGPIAIHMAVHPAEMASYSCSHTLSHSPTAQGFERVAGKASYRCSTKLRDALATSGYEGTERA